MPEKIRTLLRSQWFFLLLVVIVISGVTASVNPRYLKTSNIVSILEQISVLGLVAAGATILIVSGNFDISVGAAVGLASCIIAMLMNSESWAAWAVPVGLCAAVACGLFVGAVSVALRAPSFIVSLACIGIFKGISLAMTDGTIQTIYGKFETLGATRFYDVIPLLFLISLGGYLAVHFMLTYTRLGRRVYAIGSNPRAAYLAGISVNRNKLVFFALNGLLVGIAAVLLLSRVGSAAPSSGSGMELKAIGAVVIGGAPMSGGKGRIIGTFFGVLLMGVISNVLNMLRVNPYFQDIAFGLLILGALAVSLLSQRIRNRGASAI
ncbi:MAG: ABC transporter permease [Phycisphaerae bacterium]|jgi:ribose transport system permease protein|nr:ABC transporter permease [Phycisphaerae bacterium]